MPIPGVAKSEIIDAEFRFGKDIPVSASPLSIEERAALVNRGKRLQYFTILWNSLEALVAVISGLIAGSISLVGFNGEVPPTPSRVQDAFEQVQPSSQEREY